MMPSLLLTADGSHTLQHPQLHETYHSRHGALAESEHVFIKHGLLAMALHTGTLQVLEVGLGTGLNALLAQLRQPMGIAHLHYTALEPFPVPAAVLQQLNHGHLLGAQAQLMALHQAPWEQVVQLSPRFWLEKRQTTLKHAQLPPGHFHLIFYDAFAPSKQAEMWELPALQAVAAALAIGGRMVSYCSQGQFRRHLQACGLQVSKVPGPPGKREMTVALRTA